MSHLTYSSYPGFGTYALESTHYSQAVRLPSPQGDIIQISGQGGWDRATGEIVSVEWAPQIDQAFENVDVTLKDAGGKGWSQVYSARIFVAPLDMENGAPNLVRNLKTWCPDHKPLLTVIGVDRLAFDGMKIEIEVSAHLGQ
jgi:enamine deaminase RidA (YjgF/YER057c/UK114 family)